MIKTMDNGGAYVGLEVVEGVANIILLLVQKQNVWLVSTAQYQPDQPVTLTPITTTLVLYSHLTGPQSPPEASVLLKLSLYM